jgi:site-specific DNA-cytosine methylase
VDNTEQSPVILSICPGILGLERGLERAIGPFCVAAYVEIEAFIIANLVYAREQGVLAPAPVWTDVKTFDGNIVRGKIDGIIGGYPCQPFSNAGKQLGTEDPRHLWPYIQRIIAAARPVWCFFENVEGHLSLGYDQVYRSLRDMGYQVEAGMYSAEEVGAPHQRNRLFILAIREEWFDAGANSDGVALGNAAGRRPGGLRNPFGTWQGYGTTGTGEVLSRTTDVEHAENNRHERRGECNNNTYGWDKESECGREERGGSQPGGSGETTKGVDGVGLANSEHYGQFATENRESNTERKRGDETGENITEQLEGCSSEPIGYNEGSATPLAVGDGQRYFHSESEKHTAEGGEHAQCDTTADGGENGDVALGDAFTKRLQGCEQHGAPDEGQRPSESYGSISESSSSGDRWPARPGEQQYEWEEYRTFITEASARLLRGYGKEYPEAFQAWQIEQSACNDLTLPIETRHG